MEKILIHLRTNYVTFLPLILCRSRLGKKGTGWISSSHLHFGDWLVFPDEIILVLEKCSGRLKLMHLRHEHY